MDRSRRGFPTANPPVAHSLNEEVFFDDEIFKEIEDYTMEEERVQTNDPTYLCLRRMFGGWTKRVHPRALSL